MIKPDSRRPRKRIDGYTISAVAERYGIHPQTLRLYEREGLLKPFRSVGNTRYYSDTDLERLETILTLTRDLGVNLAGVEVILNLQEQMTRMREEMTQVLEVVQDEIAKRLSERETAAEHALVPRSTVVSMRRVVVSDSGASKRRESGRRETDRLRGGDRHT
jgi:MerR family transcriptional regulator/heat shock protein HspR